jgi:hypothetical protein
LDLFTPADIADGEEEEDMVLNVASTHKDHFATKTNGSTVENVLQEIKHKKEERTEKK